MSFGEIFSRQRLQKCLDIQKKILNNAFKTKRFVYTVRATDSVNGLAIEELQTHYFSVGVGEDLTDVPFIDLLVIFSAIEKQNRALLEYSREYGKLPQDFKARVELITSFSDEEAARLLSCIYIHAPFDGDKVIRIGADVSEGDERDDD